MICISKQRNLNAIRVAWFPRCLFFPSPVESKGGEKTFETTLSACSTVVKLTLSYLLSHSQYQLQCNDKLGSTSKYMYVSTINWGKTRGNDVCYDTVYLGEGRGIGGIGIVRCLVTLRAEADRLTGRRAEGPLLAGYMIVSVGLNITDGGSAFPSPPPLPAPSLPPGLSPRSTTLRSLYRHCV